MDIIKEGDIVARLSYNCDIIFLVEKITKINGKNSAILKGITTRILADANINDLVLYENKEIIDTWKVIDKQMDNRIDTFRNYYIRNKSDINIRTREDFTFRWR